MGNSYTDLEKQQLKRFGLHLRALRLERGISQEKLAELADLNRTYLGDVERGERNISFLNLLKLSKALGCLLSELLAHDFYSYGDQIVSASITALYVI